MSRPCLAKSGAIAALGAVMLGLSPPVQAATDQAAADACGSGPPQVTVEHHFAEPRFVFDLSMAQLSARPIDTVLAQRSHDPKVGGLMQGNIAIRHAERFEVRNPTGAQPGCIRLSAVTLRIIGRPTVFIASDYPEGTCQFDVIMEHEMQHVDIDRMLVANHGPRIKKGARKALAGLSTQPVATMAELALARDKLRLAVRDAVAPLTREMLRLRTRFQNGHDRGSEYKQRRDMCTGWK